MFKRAAIMAMMSILIGAAPTSRPVNDTELRLWPGKAPRADGDKPADIPTITVFLPDPAKATGAAVVVCPGGGYGMLATGHEGKDVCHWLNDHGVAAVMLKYRISPYHQPAPLLDGQRAVRYVRHYAKEWNIDPHKVGIMGFSAGGHVASSVGTHYDTGVPNTDPVGEESCRPDFMILVYPVITMKEKITHPGSKKILLGDNPAAKLVNFNSNEMWVTDDTPPAFIVHSKPDDVVPVKNSQLFADALKSHKVPVEYLELPTGGHGYGMAPNDPAISIWTTKCLDWMKGRGLLTRKA